MLFCERRPVLIHVEGVFVENANSSGRIETRMNWPRRRAARELLPALMPGAD